MKNNKIRPLKKLGQNFLTDPNIIRKIVASLDARDRSPVLEIGPGRGALTGELGRIFPNFSAVELDRRCVEMLRDEHPGITIVQGDFLKAEIGDFFSKDERIRVIGNIPYYITSPILFKLLESREKISETVLMVQLEIARRLTAQPRTKDYGILSVVFQAFCSIELLFKVSPNVFTPVPGVWSAVIRLQFLTEIEGMADPPLFTKVVRAAFGNRRKVLRNSFSNSVFRSADFAGCPIDLTKRAEELSIEDFKVLTAFLSPRVVSNIRGNHGTE